MVSVCELFLGWMTTHVSRVFRPFRLRAVTRLYFQFLFSGPFPELLHVGPGPGCKRDADLGNRSSLLPDGCSSSPVAPVYSNVIVNVHKMLM